jgi:glycosyltransferase involved in cell wall biosynthesis
MKKIAFVVQQYGVEVNGGAEYYCRILAERLTALYEVDVLTSCSLEYVTWSNHYPAGASAINGVNVLRFPTLHNRDEEGFELMIHKLTRMPPPGKSKLSILLEELGRHVTGKTNKHYGQLWAEYQGPYVPDLISYLKQNHNKYDALVFVTYLYYPTIAGLNVAPRKSILIPTAHDEPSIHLPMFKRFFSLPKAMLYISAGEKRFVDQAFSNKTSYTDILGVGIEPAQVNPDLSAATILGTDAPYVIYIGRIDTLKGCDVLFDYFIRYKVENPSPLKLVLVGQTFMTIPEHPDLVLAGFVEEAVKVTLLKSAKALLIASLYESLSMVTLESFSYGVPVIANGNCEVIRDHVQISQGGMLYTDYVGFDDAVHKLLSQDTREMGENGKTYIEQNYTWDKVLAKFAKAVDYVTGR